MPTLTTQLSPILSLQKKHYRKRRVGRPDKLIDWAQNFTAEFLRIRADRADDLEKPELVKARALSRQFFGKSNHHFTVTCMDGRIPLAVPMSHVPHVGGVMRTAAGDFEGFKDGVRSGSIIIDESSFTAHAVKELLRSKAGDVVHYSFDSHLGCKARADSEAIAGSEYDDAGLLVDIKRKISLARGITKLREKLKKQGEKVATLYPQFFSYDPHDGTIIQGLELHVDTVQNEGFSSRVLSQLAKDGKIVMTWQFLNDPEIATVLKKHVRSTDFRNRFSESMLTNWEAITSLYDGGEGYVFRKIYDSLVRTYDTAGWKIGIQHDIDHKRIHGLAIKNKAKIMLKNLVTRWSIAQHKHEWPFATHHEHGIVLTEGGFGPFRAIDMFSVYSKGELLNHTYKAIEIVRLLRAGGLSDPLGIFSDPREFAKAPVLIMNKAILRGMSAKGWDVVEKIDVTSAIASINWDSLDVREWRRTDIKNRIVDVFKNYPEALIHLAESTAYVDAVYELFDRLRQFMFDERFRPLLLSGSVIIVNLIVDEDRRAKIILPFVV